MNAAAMNLDDAKAALAANVADAIDNMSRATRTRSRRVFDDCKRRRAELDAERTMIVARLAVLDGSTPAAGAVRS